MRRWQAQGLGQQLLAEANEGRKAEGETAALREELAKARAANATLTQQLDEARRQKYAAVQQQDVVAELLSEMLIATGYQY